VQLEVRHTVKFNYKNLLLLVSYVCPSQDEVQADTVNFVLMDEDGHWQGKGIGRLFQVEEQLRTLHIGKSDSCVIKVSYLNPDSLLLGVNDLGLRLY
jgi:gliding motility-associated lipoprotein GldH